jgi:ElaA protein
MQIVLSIYIINMNWQIKSFKQLTTDELYDILKLRVDVFVVEQECFYPELDNLDRHLETRHVFLYQQDNISAYLRILPAGTTYPEHCSIGRVIIAEAYRGQGLAHQLIELGINSCKDLFSGSKIKISAQEHLSSFYQMHHFAVCSEMYLEDGIPHISMEYQNS